MSPPAPPPYRLHLLGPWDLRGPDGERIGSVLAQPKRLCLLAYLALADGPVSRAHLAALFWPESDEVRARNALSQAVHYLRRSLTKRAVEGVEGDRLLVSPEWMGFDVRELLERDHHEALAEVTLVENGPRPDFFQGWNAEDSQQLQDWLDGMRERVRGVVRRVEARAAANAPPAAGPSSEVTPVGSDAGPGEPPVGVESTSRGGRFARRRTASFILTAALAVVGVIAISASFGSSAGGKTQRAAVVVLLPSMNSSGSTEEYLPFPPIALRDEVVAVLTPHELVRVVRSPFAETGPLVRSLVAQGATEVEDSIEFPDWAVTLSVRLGDDQVRVIASLLTGRDFTEVRTSRSKTYDLRDDEHALLELPRIMAQELVSEFGSVIAGEGVRR
jgi:hypothetical protein